MNMPLPQSLEVISGFAEAERYEYVKVVGKSGRAWFYPSELDNCADYIYCTDSADWNKAGSGFGGASIPLQMRDGTRFELKGGWHSNDEAFLEDTGIDIRDKHMTFVIVAKDRADGAMIDVVYYDEAPQIGLFNRAEKTALNMAKEINEPLYYFSRSAGGSISARVYP
jgi:hypothetical protein